MSCFSLNLDYYGLELLVFFMLIVPAMFYGLGLLEGPWGRRMVAVGVLFHLASVAQRWVQTGRLPLSEKHDNISFMALSMALLYLACTRRGTMRSLSLYAVPLIITLLCVAMAHRTLNDISPFMQTPWFYLHVFFYFVSFAFMGVSAAAGVHYLTGGDTRYESLQYRLNSWAWLLLSCSLFAGSVWFYLAYGMYWLWTSKEMWTTICWLYYGLYLHARLIRGLSGRPVAAIGAVGFVVAMFSYFGVGTVIPSPPTQF